MKLGFRLSMFAAFAMIVIAAPATASAAKGTKVKKSKIIVNGVKYRRKTAHDALLGRYGQARGKQMDFKANAPKSWLKKNVKLGTKVKITSQMRKDLNVSARIKEANAKAKLGISSSKKARLELQFITFDSEYKIINAINKSGKIRNRLKDLGSKARIVTGVWILIDGSESSNRCAGGGLSVDTGKYGAYELSGKGCAKHAYSFSPDTVMAYEISKIKWKGVGKNKRVKSLKMDKMEF